MTDQPSPIDDLTAVIDTTGDLIATVRPDQWAAPTPCPEWSVRDLVAHLVAGHRLFAGILRGEPVLTPDALEPKDIGDDPAGAYREAGKDLLVAFGAPGVLARVVEVPVGPVPGVVAARLRAVEDLVHGWDLATATGRRARFPDEVAERALEFSRAKLDDVPPDHSPFAPPRPVAGDAPPLDRLVALLGREVSAPR